MHCEQIQPLLNALADDELLFWQRLHISWHLKRCADCTAELEAIRALGAEASAWRNVKAPEGLETRIAAVIAASLESGEPLRTLSTASSHTHSLENLPMNSILAMPLLARRSSIWRWQTLAALSLFALTLTTCAWLVIGPFSSGGLSGINSFFTGRYTIPSESMEPTLMGHDAAISGHADAAHDQVLVNKLAYLSAEPKHGDIVLIKAPPEADVQDLTNGQKPQENILVKRLVGLPGDTVEVKVGPDGSSSVLYINGNPLNEPYLKELMEFPSGAAKYAVNSPLKLEPGEYFVMGDNRNNSNDSRYWGTLERARILGKVTGIYWPLERQRTFP